MLLYQTEIEKDEASKRAWRWDLEIGFFYIHLTHKVSFNSGDTWNATMPFFEVSLQLFDWRYGSYSAYYDGYFHSYSFGPLHVNWGY